MWRLHVSLRRLRFATKRSRQRNWQKPGRNSNPAVLSKTLGDHVGQLYRRAIQFPGQRHPTAHQAELVYRLGLGARSDGEERILQRARPPREKRNGDVQVDHDRIDFRRCGSPYMGAWSAIPIITSSLCACWAARPGRLLGQRERGMVKRSRCSRLFDVRIAVRTVVSRPG